ncbi:MAG: 23S rRNA pseudouridine synthase F [Tenericutes bacterium GWC2_39_45]|nr:MAG: 23S rRNA pseudouridine synthase F [Tenericutes bacterium GWC2_39_45]OHE32539.1 MAG: 23S rRNA pseudouridine synthase F [Tenericutes bacterium GWD2_38_27]OHE39949.1 MAG: 23S rRNA pseudouridine synthase F [Tenericutes bacterium GWF2_38_8]HBG33277.1 23S rRNA pseudouridine synthase F [Acholeplasmataceae bacterium]HCB67177.1 23S rRNA pseudouridine synthase F [Acholeplasmataceae bacterium]
MEVRINKYLSESGFCSRREADRLIEQGRVLINGEHAQIGSKIRETDVVTVDGKSIKNNTKMVYLAFNKPIGIVSTTDQKIKNNLIDFINYPQRIFHIGRLDKDSEGLILLTNDGDIVNEILRAENNHEKEYIVEVDRRVLPDFIEDMSKGVPILKTVTKPCIVEKVSEKSFRIILTEGMNRQIRRMCETFGYTVLSLKRVRIMHIPLDIPSGHFRPLSNKEKDLLFKMIGRS